MSISHTSPVTENDITRAANTVMTQRLRRIEHELEMMILLQKVASSAASLRASSNNQVNYAIKSTTENQLKESKLNEPSEPVKLSPIKGASNHSRKIESICNSPEASGFSFEDTKEAIEIHKKKNPPNNPYLDDRITSPPKHSSTKNIKTKFKKKIIQDNPKCGKSHSEPSYLSYKTNIQEKMKTSNSSSPLSSFSSSSKSTPVIHTYSDPLNELIQQVTKSESRREKLENALASVQSVFKNKQQAIRQVLQSKQVAIEMARHLKSRYESLRASNDARGKALEQAQMAQTELISRFEQTESAKRELENQLIQLEEQLAESAMANAHLQQQIPILTNQISQLTKEVASNAEAMSALSQVESRLIRYRDSAEQSALAVEAIQLRCQKLSEQLIQKNILQQDKVEMEKVVTNLQQTTANQEKEIQDLLSIKRSNEMKLLESEQQILRVETESNQLRQKNYELERKLSNVCNTITALDDIRKELAEQAARHETERHELSSLLKVYQQESNEARAEAQTANDNIRIKDKIIADQGDSILHLKQQVQEKLLQIQKLTEQKNLLEKQLVEANSRLNKAEMKIKQLEQQREEMEEQFERLNQDLESHYKQELCPPEAYEKYKAQLVILEEQVRERQQEYLIRLNELTDERNKESNLAQQARIQLIDTIREFEAQIEIHRQAQSILKAALKSKDEELQMANAASSRLKLELQESKIYAQHNRAAIEEKLRMACNACSQLIDHLILGPGMVVAELEDEETTFLDQS